VQATLSRLCCLSVCDVAVLWPNSWMDQDETWHGGRPRLGRGKERVGSREEGKGQGKE